MRQHVGDDPREMPHAEMDRERRAVRGEARERFAGGHRRLARVAREDHGLRDARQRQLDAERRCARGRRGHAGHDLVRNPERGEPADLLADRAVERRIAGMHARDVLPLAVRAREQRDDFVEIELRRVHDELGAMAVEHRGRHERARVQDHRATAHEALALHRDQLGVARTRADEVHRHSTHSVIHSMIRGRCVARRALRAASLGSRLRRKPPVALRTPSVFARRPCAAAWRDAWRRIAGRGALGAHRSRVSLAVPARAPRAARRATRHARPRAGDVAPLSRLTPAHPRAARHGARHARSASTSAAVAPNSRSASGSAGRSTITTGTRRSRATSSFASVAAPPLFLLTTTSIAAAANSARSPSSENGPRAASTCARALPACASRQRTSQCWCGAISSRCASGSRPSVKSGRANGAIAASTPAQSATPRQSSPGRGRHGARRSAQYGTPAARQAAAAFALIRAANGCVASTTSATACSRR
ncbi:precorrin-4 C11-methyltransferase domain protein [Burkholderia pseudomallei MSHR2990]|nr:precorrin-4 C11-methyltransferase domain protein [Burkholderia pseudomallei MSHR2990]